ncbi:hypothetical protein ACFL5K_03820 [Gemmatimonadota bacterium]
MNNIILTVITSAITAVLTVSLGWLSIIVKNKIFRKEKKETEKEKMKREAFEKLLEIHSKKVQREHYESDWLEKFAKMCNLIIVWSSDSVLLEYALFMQKYPSKKQIRIEEYEKYFGQAVLEFRKELGYKNKDNKITPEQIVLIFKTGWDNPL